jgi:hypothetical protein
LDRLRAIVAWWRHGPAGTRAGVVLADPFRASVTGQHHAPTRPALARLAHIRAALAIRLPLEASDACRDAGVVAQRTAHPRRPPVLVEDEAALDVLGGQSLRV